MSPKFRIAELWWQLLSASATVHDGLLFFFRCFVNIDDAGVAGVVRGFVAGDALQVVGDVAHAFNLGEQFFNVGPGFMVGQLDGH